MWLRAIRGGKRRQLWFGLLGLIWFCPIQELPAAAPAGYYLVWSDEFNGSSLDSTKWANWLLGKRHDAYNVADAISFNGSNLVITTYTSNNVHYTGMISTSGKFHPRWGYIEASIDYNDTNGMWSAYWMQSPTMGKYVGDPAFSGTEIDICEHRRVDSSGNNIDGSVQANIHWDGYGTDHKSTGSGNIGSGLGTGFHTYGLKWTDTSHAVLIDDVQKWSTTTAVSDRSEFLILSSEVKSNSWAGTPPPAGFGSRNTSPVRMVIDYVRYYAPTTTVFWDGSSSGSWTDAANWVANRPPGSGFNVVFDYGATANRSTTLGQDFSINGIAVLETRGAISVGGNRLTLGAGGIDLVSANNNLTIYSPVTLAAAQKWSIATNRTLTVNGPVSGAGSLTIDGYGTNILTASNSFSGATRLMGGFLRINSLYALQASTLDMNSSTSDTGVLLPGGPLVVGGLSGSRDVNFGSTTVSVGNNNQNTSFSGALSNNGTLNKIGTGTLTLSGTNSVWVVNINSGTLAIGNSYALGSSAYPATVAPGAQLNLIGGGLGTGSVRKNLTLAGNNNGVYAAPLRVGGGSTPPVLWAGTVTLSSDASIQLDGSRIFTLSNSATAISSSGRTLTLAGDGGSAGEVIGGIALGTGGLIKSGGGTWKLSGANTYAGDTRVPGGVLLINHPNALQSSTVDLNAADAGTLNLNNLDAMLGGLEGTRNLALGSGAVSVGHNDQSTIYSGILSGAGSLTKEGLGALTLMAGNIYSGSTIVQGGALLVMNSTNSATGAGAVTVASGAALGGSGLISGPVTVAGAIAPGNSVGSLTTGLESWSGGGLYVCELTNAALPGSWDTLTINGPLTVEAGTSSKFQIKLVSLTPGGPPGPATGFDNQSDYSWTIATAAGGINKFNPDAFTVDTTGFANDLGGGAFTVEREGNTVRLKFHANTVPARFTATQIESGTFVLSAVGVPGKSYGLFSTTNLAPPISWLFETDAVCDINGLLAFTNSIAIGLDSVLYRLQAQ